MKSGCLLLVSLYDSDHLEFKVAKGDSLGRKQLFCLSCSGSHFYFPVSSRIAIGEGF